MMMMMMMMMLISHDLRYVNWAIVNKDDIGERDYKEITPAGFSKVVPL